MPPGLRQITQPLFDWLENRQGGDAISGVFFGVGLLVLVFLLPGGFVSGMRKLRARFIRVVPNPSWLSDVERDTGEVVEIVEPTEAPEANVLT
jgi:hypothetical protein